jgi:phage shock protein E
MSWTTVFLFAAVLAIFLFLKRSGQISVKEAQTYLKGGALVIDVRTAAEFSSGHLPKAINMPLGEIESSLPRRIKDRNQVLLLHCHSGMRSGMARKKLVALGYTHAFNLGSYSRAVQIVKGK